MEKNDRPKGDQDELKQVYKQWQDFMSKSKVKMKKKIKKDKKQYYDFDYTRGQYYYNYPEYHINFAPPQIQRAFFKDILQQQTKPLSNVYNSETNKRKRIEDLLQPLELHDFLKEIRKKFEKEITTLRIQKSFYMKQTSSKSQVIDFMEDQIRSFNCRLIRFQNVYFTFQKSLRQRLQDRTTTLKLKRFDEMHFSQLQKGDFVVYLRMEGAKQRLIFQSNRLINEIQISFLSKKWDIIKRCYEKRGAKIKDIQKFHAQKYIERKTILDQHFISNDPVFYDTEQNLKIMETYLQSLNYTRQVNKYKSYYDVNIPLKELDYIPSSQSQLKQILFSVCKDYFPIEMIENLYTHKKEHLCYRVNYFGSIILRAIVESYNFIIEIKEKDLHSMRNTMKRQLQTIFTNQADKLFNILQHQIICLVDQGSYELPYFPKISSSQNQNIFKDYFKINKIVDPFTKSIINLLSTSSDKTIKQIVDNYAAWVHQIVPNKLKYLSLYYKNFHNDRKNHLINLLNSKLSISAFSNNVLEQKFDSILNKDQKIDEGLTRITYLLYAINSIQIKKELDNIVSAQISIMYKVKYKLNLLEHKHNIPFQMSTQFLGRFSESSNSFDFISQGQVNHSIPYPEIDINDKIVRVKNGNNREKIQVRRIIPQNPLFEGKRIMYHEAIKEVNEIVEKIHFVCAFMIEQRENYLHQEAFSGIVDRFRLVNNLLKLEIEYHNKKLKYMQELLHIFQHTINPEGIFLIASQIYAAKHKQVYVQLNQPHFEDIYTSEAQLWNCKYKVLEKMRIKQMKYQDQQKIRFRQNLIKNNHINNVPQISSIYYSDELAMEADDNIVEEAEDESMSEVMSQSQFVMNSSKYRSDLSGISSEYHVKTTFKQILGRNSINSQAIDLNKREELMGRKKKKLLNDSVLGGILSYEECKYYRYIHHSIIFMKKLQNLFESQFQTEDPGIKKQFYQDVNSFIDSFSANQVKQINLIDENMLNKHLADCNRSISKVIEKCKIGPLNIDQYMFFNSKIFKDFLDNNNFTNLNDLRGLYTCLNIVKLYKEYPKYLLNTLTQQNIIKELGSLSKKYSSQNLSKQTKFAILDNIKSKYDFGSYLKAIDAPVALSASKSLLFLSNNGTFTNIIFASIEATTGYYKSLLENYYEEVHDYRSFLTNLELIQLSGTYFDNKILNVNGIENRLSIRRKIESTNQRLGRLFKTKNIEEFISLPHACFQLIKKQQLKGGSNETEILQNIQMFQDFILELASSVVLINTATYKIQLKIIEKYSHLKTEKYAKILPYVSTQIYIKSIMDNIYKEMFQQNFKGIAILSHSYNKQNSKQQKLIQIQFKKITYQNLAKNVYRDNLNDVKKYVKPLFQRKHKEFTLSENALQKYYDYLDVKRYEQPYRLDQQAQLKDIFDYHSQVNRSLNLLTWIQCKILLFGASLKPQQLIYFRCMLLNIAEHSQIFFRDESSRLLNYYDIMKMKLDNVDTHSTSQRYINSFLNYENLKIKYKNFLDTLGELDINNEGREIINIMYVGNKALFKYCDNSLPDYLESYCSIRKLKNETNQLVEFVTKNNPNRYLRNKNCRKITFSLLKTFIWDLQNQQNFKHQVFFLEQRCEVIKQILNSNNNKMKDMTHELAVQLYTRERMRQIHQFLKISINKKDRIQYAFFLKKLQEDLLLGIDKLNPIQKYLSKFIEKILKEKPELVNIKDQIIEKIYETRFYEQLILTKLNNMSVSALNRQLKLYQILFQNYHQRELIRQNKIIKNTMNKVLVPKIIINPYLQSPLIIENYFFAAALKLSYIDNFLNKLKNRAILVQLAEGGFGFLLKISELDECIQSLCKGVITFTQKEFSDRFRTFIEAHDQLKEKYKKCLNTNQTLKNMINICRQQWGKQIKSVIYSKLNSYIGTIHSKEKSYQSIFNIVKSLQLQIAKKIDLKYENRIKSLQEENRKLKETFIQYRMITQRNARTSMEQSKDMLYNNFKRQVEGILNKQVVKDYKETGQKQHQQQQQYMSSILLKRLRKQKIFYEMKICNMQAKLRQKSNEINKLKEQLTTIQNTLTSDQFKNAKLTDQIKRLFDKNIEIEELKRQIAKRQQQQTLNKLKLIKVNEHLQGRITRLQQKNKVQLHSVERQVKKDERDMGIQAVFLTQKRQKRHFRIKTQYSQQQQIKNQNKLDQVPLWRQKWQNSERKYHILMSKIVQAYQVYRMNKNGSKLIDRIAEIFGECINNQILRKK